MLAHKTWWKHKISKVKTKEHMPLAPKGQDGVPTLDIGHFTFSDEI